MSKSSKKFLSDTLLSKYILLKDSPYTDYSTLNTILYCIGTLFRFSVVTYLWNVFMGRLGLPSVSLALTIGIWSVAFTFATSVEIRKDYPRKDELDFTKQLFINLYVIPVMGLVVGSVARLFI